MTPRGGTPTRADMLHDFTDMNRHAGTGICECPEPWPSCKGTNKRPTEGDQTVLHPFTYYDRPPYGNRGKPPIPPMIALGLLCAVLYVACIWFANYLIQRYGFVSVGFGLAAPAGVYAAGLALTMRDVTQRLLGRRVVIACILAGAALSYTISPAFATASAVAFLISEAADFAIYTPLERRSFLAAILASNAVGLVVDSVLFLSIAFGSLAYLNGQLVGKAWITLLSVGIIASIRATYKRLSR